MTERFWVPSGVSVSGPLPPNDGQAWRELVPLADLQAAQEERDEAKRDLHDCRDGQGRAIMVVDAMKRAEAAEQNLENCEIGLAAARSQTDEWRARAEALEARFESLAEELERRADCFDGGFHDGLIAAAQEVRQAPHEQEVGGGGG